MKSVGTTPYVQNVRHHLLTAVVAGSTAWAVTYLRAEASPAVDAPAVSSAASKPHPGRSTSIDRVAAGIARVAWAPAPSIDVDEVVPFEEPEPRPDPRAAREDEIDEHESLLEDSRGEPRDDAWATSMEDALTGAVVVALEESGASLQAVECRSTTCEATVRYADAAAAQSHARDLVTGIRSTECSKRLTLTQEPDAAPFDATLYFDCDVTP